MNEKLEDPNELDSTLFHKNSQKFLLEKNLEPYYDKQVAWSWDGTEILASADSLEQLYNELENAGIPSNRVVLGWIPDPNIFYCHSINQLFLMDSLEAKEVNADHIIYQGKDDERYNESHGRV